MSSLATFDLRPFLYPRSFEYQDRDMEGLVSLVEKQVEQAKVRETKLLL